jgi:ParB family chromosome partitioning protein
MMDIPINQIDDFPLRVNASSDISELASSISLHGQLSPICVRPHPTKKERYQVIYGNRRLAALRSLGRTSVNANVVVASDANACLMAFAENSDRKDFSDYV